MEHERIVHILEYLSKYTDSERYVSINDIIRHLENSCGITNVSQVTVRRDLNRLETSGKKLDVRKGAHNTSFYSLSDDRFTFNEIRFLVDSVSINKFLSNGQKQKLFKKFEGMCSEAEVRKLISRIQLSDIAPPDLNLLDNLEKIHIIISEKRKINFDYGKFDVDKQMKYYSKRRSMIPCLVVYYDDHFYLKCINEEDEKVRTYRIDRMKNIKSGEVTHKQMTIPKPDGVVLDMFEPDYFELITLKVKKFLLDDMLEQFGKYANIRHDLSDNDSVVVNVRVGISDSFYRWIMKYGSNIEILSPERIRNNFIDELRKITEIYEK